ncbi:CinA family protein [Entomospira nematocerorum]|uniref:CinA family protein n=1 Tax=Entomospira nematocerorum TaxID=2719987 RepID=A0A968GGN2_9SPIO|nr:CinA family protein [Entomospira nematocera]NIZ47486.1 CinA family protein [Entomospira nematocera]WDI33974.1 CinA family protein [Entomospira nematocera]
MLAKSIITYYKENNRILLLTESITAGGIAQRLAEVPGASEVLWGSLVLYQAAAKSQILQINNALLSPDRIASQETVIAMAQATIHLYHKNQEEKQKNYSSLSISGFADGSQAGVVSCALITENNIHAVTWNLSGTRNEIQQTSIHLALELLALPLQ